MWIFFGRLLLVTGTTETAQGNDAAFTSLTGEFECCTAVQIESRTVTLPADMAAGAAVLEWTWAGDGPYFDCTDLTVSANADGDGDGGGANNGIGGGGGSSASGDGDSKNAAIALMAALLLVYLYCKFCTGGGDGGGADKGADLPAGWVAQYDQASGAILLLANDYVAFGGTASFFALLSPDVCSLAL